MKTFQLCIPIKSSCRDDLDVPIISVCNHWKGLQYFGPTICISFRWSLADFLSDNPIHVWKKVLSLDFMKRIPGPIRSIKYGTCMYTLSHLCMLLVLVGSENHAPPLGCNLSISGDFSSCCDNMHKELL